MQIAKPISVIIKNVIITIPRERKNLAPAGVLEKYPLIIFFSAKIIFFIVLLQKIFVQNDFFSAVDIFFLLIFFYFM
ncbi:MAG: hypothetical protein A2275_07785 [Bacteroidetes bacterium RIFOXYA12_FULL_35_11]|nr:MAG: hypothetical protein A2X01_18280 [Bacteroidetes bacterium GWF2_35_48]OFY76426.1 MAG: hypothetical protein A2275_07785 [Bacteroidetes bacterium RIFOXYA12_FULL_35_11]OFY94431.1 MAG: hypothetical protein A2309_03185 [Bacteroidetes bacterium RIFOXYB2_FULL_35_7]OFZ00679.1 MAG: hypothetical protein A2491_14985 [Bacteroidetes bacterium RIFOXYC12_FULL_35_7]